MHSKYENGFHISIVLVVIAIALPFVAAAQASDGDRNMLIDYQSLVDDLVRDDDGRISTAQRDSAIALAVLRYSQDRPREELEDLVAASAGHVVDLPGYWDPDFSKIVQIEFPIGDVPPTYLRPRDYDVYVSPGTRVLMVNPGLAVNDTLRTTFTLHHQVDESVDTIPAAHRDPVASYAASLLLRQLAALYSGERDSTIQADTVSHGSQASAFSRRADELRARYYDALGLDPKRTVAAGIQVNWDKPPGFSGTRLSRRTS